jgi:hypothetical protein
MNEIEAFTSFLTEGIGLTLPRQRAAIVNYGYDTCRGLMDASTEGIKTVFENISRANRDLDERSTVHIREQIKQRFYGARLEFLMRITCGAEINNDYLQSLTTADVDGFVRKHNLWKEYKTAANNMTLPNVTIPTLTKTNWKVFSQSMTELLTRQRGTYSIPLNYVIRPDAVGDYDIDYGSTEDQLRNCLLLRGGNYRSDNSVVWSLLSEHTTGTEAESIVKRFHLSRNGRTAWLALISHMESTSYLDNLKSSAMASLAAAIYNGERKNFGIVKYFTVHSNAHNDLDTANEPLTDGMKITHFLQGLKDETAMNFAISTKAEPGINTFEEFYNSFSAKLTTKLTLTTPALPTTQRQINSVNHENNGYSRPQGRGYGRGRSNGRGNSGRGFTRGGRGRGRGRNNYRGGGRHYRDNRFNPVTHWRPRTGAYNDDEWSQLSYDQRQRVHDLRSVMRPAAGNNQDRERNINQVSHNGSIPGEVQLPPAPPSTAPPPPPFDNRSIASQPGRRGDAFSSSRSRNPN